MIQKYLKKCQEILNAECIITIFKFGKGTDQLTRTEQLEYVKGSDRPLTFILKTINSRGYIASFKLVEMPGCCGICISTGASVDGAYRNRGLGKVLNQFRKEIANYLGYTVLLCTDVDKNVAQKRILDKEGFKHVHQFTNKRTGNVVNISVFDIEDNTEG